MMLFRVSVNAYELVGGSVLVRARVWQDDDNRVELVMDRDVLVADRYHDAMQNIMAAITETIT